MTYLLDSNVLVALFDSAHVHHEPAHRWFAEVGSTSWATCPITENGFVRVVSNPAYKTVVAGPREVAERLTIMCSQAEHEFWPDAMSLTDSTLFDLSSLTGHQQLTDLYLAGLALQRGGKLATFDSGIPYAAVVGGNADVVELITSV